MRIGIFKARDFHEPILRPVYDHLRSRHDCLYTSYYGALFDFRPHVVVMGQAIFENMRNHLPNTVFVHTRHGLASKVVSYRGARECDFLCVTSTHMQNWYEQAGARPRRDFWVVGYTQLDPLFRGDKFQLPFEIDRTRKVVLYAPTFDRELSSVEMLGERFVDLIRGARKDVTLIIKPHPHIQTWQPDWMEMMQRVAAGYEHVHFVQDAKTDVIPYLQVTDVLVSDASSVFLQYLAVNRPIILINNPNRFGYRDFDPNGFEWAWRDAADQIEDVNKLPSAVDAALSNSSLREDRRMRYRNLLFGNLTDGRAAERIADKITELAAEFPARDLLHPIKWKSRRALRRIKNLVASDESE